jgi:hypothetical protein
MCGWYHVCLKVISPNLFIKKLQQSDHKRSLLQDRVLKGRYGKGNVIQNMYTFFISIFFNVKIVIFQNYAL